MDAVVALGASGGGDAGDGGEAATGGQGGSSSTGGAGGSGGTAGGPSTGLEDCSSLEAGQLVALTSRIREQCLSVGSATEVLGEDAFTTAFTAACDTPSQTFEVLDATTVGAFNLRNRQTGTNLDVLMSSPAAGTPLVLFAAHTLDNQKFRFFPRSPPYFAILAENAPGSCVTNVGPTAQIWPCDPSNPGQDFRVRSASCL